MKKHPKPGYLGPAFHAYLEYLETVECFMTEGKTRRAVGRSLTLNNRYWRMPDDESDFNEMTRSMLAVDAYLAGVVRSSVKYKISTDTLLEISTKYVDEVTHIGRTVPLRLPHQWCTIVISDWGKDDIILVAQEQVADEGKKTYPELQLDKGEEFICLNITGYRRQGVELEDGSISPANQLSHYPVEIHCQHNRTEKNTKVIYAGAGQCDPTQAGMQQLDLMFRSFLLWHHQFHLQSLLRYKRVAGAVPTPGKTTRLKRWRKKHEHPAFEHTIIQLEVDAPDPSQTGRTIFQPKKRLHQVRGFWRQYRKSGKKVWVKSHWRGDEHLGVVRRDLELVTHPTEDKGNVRI